MTFSVVGGVVNGLGWTGAAVIHYEAVFEVAVTAGILAKVFEDAVGRSGMDGCRRPLGGHAWTRGRCGGT